MCTLQFSIISYECILVWHRKKEDTNLSKMMFIDDTTIMMNQIMYSKKEMTKIHIENIKLTIIAEEKA